MLLRKEDVAMRTEFGFCPLLRSSLRFDQVLNALRSAAEVEPIGSYPRCDIERTDEDRYRVTLPVAGFRPDELTLTVQQSLLVVSGERRDREEAPGRPAPLRVPERSRFGAESDAVHSHPMRRA
jgi:molecular chaperone IbpA